MTERSPLILLGGTFDPPHVGHLVLGECARHQFGARHVLFLPAGDQYRKREAAERAGRPAPTSAEHRLAMVHLAVASNQAFSVDDREVRRTGPTYTVDTLEEIHGELAGSFSEVILVLGTDALADMPNWKQPERIRALSRIVIAPKEGAAIPSGVLAEDIVEMPRLPLSSTLIRARLTAGLPVRYLVPEPVLAYIEEQRLYG